MTTATAIDTRAAVGKRVVVKAPPMAYHTLCVDADDTSITVEVATKTERKLIRIPVEKIERLTVLGAEVSAR